MKKEVAKKLNLPRETVRALDAQELEFAVGGGSINAACGTCGNPRSTCAPA
jgi:hypothetical protein